MGPNTPSFQQGAQLWVGKEMAQKWIQVLGAAQSMPLDLQRQGRKALGCFFTLLPRARLPLLLEHTLPLLRFPQVWGKQQESSFLALVAATPVGSGPHSFPDFTDLRSQRAHCTILRKVGMGAGPRWRGVSGMCQRSRCSCLPRHPGWRQQERRSDVSGSLVRRLLLFFFFPLPRLLIRLVRMHLLRWKTFQKYTWPTCVSAYWRELRIQNPQWRIWS